MDCSLTRLLRSWEFSSQSTGVGCHFLLQGICPTQGSNPGLPHCRQNCLSNQHSSAKAPPSWMAWDCSKGTIRFHSWASWPIGREVFLWLFCCSFITLPWLLFSQDSSLSYSTSSPSMVLAAWSPSPNLPEKVRLWSNVWFLSKSSHFQQVLQCLEVLSCYTAPTWKKILKKNHTSKHVV